MPGNLAWPSALVAVALIAFVAVVDVSAIQKYGSAEEALKIASTLNGLLGLFTGAFVTYFFTKPARDAAQNAQAEARAATKKTEDSLRALVEAAGRLPTDEWSVLKGTPSIQAILPQ